MFVGMLSKTCTEDDVRGMFEPYGVVEEVTVLRDKEGQSKGCAFIKFSNRQQAQLAINKMHGSQVMTVRWCREEREREFTVPPTGSVLPAGCQVCRYREGKTGSEDAEGNAAVCSVEYSTSSHSSLVSSIPIPLCSGDTPQTPKRRSPNSGPQPPSLDKNLAPNHRPPTTDPQAWTP